MRTITFMMAAIFILFALASADWSTDPDINNPICTAADWQYDPQIVSDSFGGAIITWQDRRNGFTYDVFAQRVDANGDTLWPIDGVAICTAANDQRYPRIIDDGFGGAIITWEDERSGSYDIYAQRVDANGDTLWPADGVAICTAAYSQSNPELVGDGSGGAVITWQNGRTGLNEYDIYAQRVDANGDTLWPTDGVAICTNGIDNLVPRLVGDGAGGAIIAWQSYQVGLDEPDIYAQRIDANGDTLWKLDGVPICIAEYAQRGPRLVGDGSGGAIITWRDRRDSVDYDIYAQRVDANGDTLWAADGVAICTAAYTQYWPQLVGDGSGGAIITWEDPRSGSHDDIYTQRVDANGDTLWPADGVAICTAEDNQCYPDLVGDGSGGAIIAWEDARSGSNDIYAQRVDANGNTLWAADGVAICTAANWQSWAHLVSDDSGGAIIAWEDARSGSYSDIYAQWVKFDGTLAGGQPPAIVDDLIITLDMEDLVLTWSPVTVDTSGTPLLVDLYRIYRDTVAGFELNSPPLDSTMDTSYADTSGVVGDTGTNYFYAVTAVATAGESEPSEQVGEFDRDLSNSP